LAGCGGPPDGVDGGEAGDPDEEVPGEGRLVCGDEWTRLARLPVIGETRHLEAGSTTVVVSDGPTLLVADGETWTVHDPWPDEADETTIEAMTVTSGDAVWLASWDGSRFTAARWDGQSLTHPLVADEAEQIWAVWADQDRAWAGGRDACDQGCSARMWAFDGTSWAAMAAPAMDRVDELWGRGDGELLALGPTSSTAHFDGAAWTVVEAPATTVTSLAGDADGVFALGDGWLMQWNGEEWDMIGEAWLDPSLDEIELVAGQLWGTGDAGLFTWNGEHWDFVETHEPEPQFPVAVGDELWWVSAFGPSSGGESVWATDALGRTRLVWRDDDPDPRAAGGRSIADAWAIASTQWGHGQVHFDGNAWAWVDDEIRGFDEPTLWVGPGDGERWTVGTEPDATDLSLTIRQSTPSGVHTIPVPPDVTTHVESIHATDARDIWITSRSGAHHFDGRAWFTSPVPVGDSGEATAHADGHDWLLGARTVSELVSGRWDVVFQTKDGFLLDFRVNGVDDITVHERTTAGDDLLHHRDAAGWTTTPLGEWTICDLAGRGDEVFAMAVVDPPGSEDTRAAVFQRTHGHWRRIDVPPDEAPAACAELMVADDGLMFVDGDATWVLPCQVVKN
jgi:hypothetical protein